MLNCWPIDGARIGIDERRHHRDREELREPGSRPRAEQLFARHRQRQREERRALGRF